MKMSRRLFLEQCGSASIGLLLGLGPGIGRALGQAPPSRPNVLFISIDDLNDYVGHLGGHPQAQTPNMDRLADQGVLFTNAYCPAPSCLPSRTAILTGMAPYTTGVYENRQHWRTVLPDTVTLPRYFMNHGYYCAGAGKIFHHYQNDPDSWHEYFPTKKLQFPHYHEPTRPDQADFPRWKGMYGSFNWGPLDVPMEETGDMQSVRYVCERLQRHHDRPFFLTCGIYRPHVPWFVPRQYFEMFPLETIELPPIKEDDRDDLPPEAVRRITRDKYYQNMVKHQKRKEVVQAYLASTAYTDDLVGRLLRTLDQSPAADNTLVVLWSDHGWHLGEKHCYRKFTAWEESCRVPLIIRLPATLQARYRNRTRCDRPVNLIDLYPTLIDLCGLGERTDLSGHSLVPLLKDPRHPWPYASVTTTRHNVHSIRTQRYRYIRYEEGGEELYAHAEDPNEWHNLAHNPAYAEVKKDMQRHWPATNKPLVPTPDYNAGKAYREALESWKDRPQEKDRKGS